MTSAQEYCNTNPECSIVITDTNEISPVPFPSGHYIDNDVNITVINTHPNSFTAKFKSAADQPVIFKGTISGTQLTMTSWMNGDTPELVWGAQTYNTGEWSNGKIVWKNKQKNNSGYWKFMADASQLQKTSVISNNSYFIVI